MWREISPETYGQGLARLMRCILHSASGDEELLKQSIALCRIDYRDLIFGAEYETKFDFMTSIARSDQSEGPGL